MKDDDREPKNKSGRKRRRKGSSDQSGKPRISAEELLVDIGGGTAGLREFEDAKVAPEKEREKQGWLRKGIIILAVLVVAAGLAVVVLEWEWISGKVSGLWEDQEQVEARETYLFLTNPATGQEYRDESVNTVVGLADDKGVLHGIIEIGWNRDGGVTVYWVSEGLVGKSQDGRDLSLSDALGGNLERPGELRHIMESLTGLPVHYVVLLPMQKALLLFEALGLPPVQAGSDAMYSNIYTQVLEKVTAGRSIKDMDRIVSYLLDEGGVDEYYERVRRSQPYLEEALDGLSELPGDELTAALESMPGAFTISPSGQGEEGDVEYMASLLAAWAEGMKTGCRLITVPEITILNGCGVVGAGSNLKGMLEGRGFMVAESGGNAKVVVDGQEYNDFNHQTSVLYYGANDPSTKAFAEYVAMLYGIPKVECKESADGLTVIVGNDLAGKKL